MAHKETWFACLGLCHHTYLFVAMFLQRCQITEEKKNNVVGNLGIGGIRLWSATAAVAKGLDLTLGVILGYVAA